MGIDFSMTGLNISLLLGVVLLLQGICLLVLQNPIKKIKKFTVRDYIILGLIICFMIGGIILTVSGITSALSAIE